MVNSSGTICETITFDDNEEKRVASNNEYSIFIRGSAKETLNFDVYPITRVGEELIKLVDVESDLSVLATYASILRKNGFAARIKAYKITNYDLDEYDKTVNCIEDLMKYAK